MFLSISITTGHYATPSRAVRRQSSNISIISPLPDNSIAQIGAPPHAGRTRNIGRRCRSPAPNHRADCKRQFDENGHNKRRCGRRCRQVGMEHQLTTTARTSRCVIGHLPPPEHLPLRISTPTVADICLLVRVTVQSYTVNAWLTVGVIDTARIVVRQSVCPIYRPLQQRAAVFLLWAQRAGDIDRLLHGRRSAATAGEQCHVVS